MDDTVALGGDSVSGERARVRSAASPEGRAELRTRARRARRTPAAGGGTAQTASATTSVR